MGRVECGFIKGTSRILVIKPERKNNLEFLWVGEEIIWNLGSDNVDNNGEDEARGGLVVKALPY